ncbi:hypothetical protein B5V02_14370 [Mesorhizobium kowhaii]|uniref:Addiction module toxin RelE n=1 Tax=Mesorhizobium kowhaii TaxID=1300272 RepID=A0A2W7C552_9HYPH|nr:hypothetical protein B5V02_14370 [Mesorhizobium kowhaii]
MHIVEDPEAQFALDDAVEKWAGTPTAWEAVTWVLMRDQDLGTALTEDGKIRVFTYEGAKSIKQPTITVVYEVVGKHEIVIRNARFTEPSYAQAGRA